MKFTAASSELLSAITAVSGAVPTKSTLPILECVLFEREQNQLRITATDLEISIVEHVGVSFDANGKAKNERIAVPAKRLLDTLRALPSLPIQFSADSDFNLQITTDQGKYKMVGHDGGDYPSVPEMKGSVEIKAPGTVLKRAFSKTGFAVSKDALRPAMMGILFQIDRDQSKVVATDGHRLVKLSLSSISNAEPLEFIIPDKAMNLASKVASDEEATLTVDSGYVSIDFGHSRVIARQIDEAYPNYEAVIPHENDKRLSVNRLAMLAAVKRVGLYSSSMTNQIRLSLDEGRMEVSAEDLERSSEAQETILCEYSGEPLVIGFNATYLTEVLSNIDSDDATFAFSTANRAGVVTPDVQASGEEVLMLIMPVMLNTYA